MGGMSLVEELALLYYVRRYTMVIMMLFLLLLNDGRIYVAVRWMVFRLILGYCYASRISSVLSKCLLVCVCV